MNMVNTTGTWTAGYGPLKHAGWHGFTITDWVFPSFLFVVGNALSFSMIKLKKLPAQKFFNRVLKRAILIFIIGLLLGMFPFFKILDGQTVIIDLSTVRPLGVLQRIALCYLIAAILIRYGGLRGTLAFSLAILLFYWGIMYWFGTGEDPYDLLGNAARRVDLWLIGESHLYRGEGVPFDPEGLLSTLPATVNVLGGYWVGHYLQSVTKRRKACFVLFVVGLLLITLGWLWDPFFPINKKIWTSSFVLFTTGWSILVLVLLIYLLEILNWKSWAYFFEVFGKNPLILYVLSGVLVRIMAVIYIEGVPSKNWIFDHLFATILPLYFASFIFSVIFMLVIWVIGYIMDRKSLYIKV